MPEEEIRAETARDTRLAKLAVFILDGNFRACKQDDVLQPYSHVFTELSVIQRIIMHGNRMVLPKSLQQKAIKLCHEGHMGIVKTKKLLRSKVWFPGIDSQVQAEISGCIPCQGSIAGKVQRNPLQMTILRTGPWRHASADFSGPLPSGEAILVVTDTYSRYPEVEIVTSTSAKSVLPAFDKIFTTHGIPQVIKTDHHSTEKHSGNSQQKRDSITIELTPRWPEANGQVENFMKNINKVIRTADICGKDWKRGLYAYLLNYHDTVHPSTGQSLYTLSSGRTIRTKIPTAARKDERLQKQVQIHDQQEKAKAKAADESRGTAPHKFREGDTVLVRQQKQNCLRHSKVNPTSWTT